MRERNMLGRINVGGRTLSTWLVSGKVSICRPKRGHIADFK